MKHPRKLSPERKRPSVPDKAGIERATGSQGGQSDKSESGFIAAERNETAEKQEKIPPERNRKP